MIARKIAIVVQRYGQEVNGGAEFLTRLIAERLAQYSVVEVFTTCAIDHVTWKNEYEPGVQWLNGVKINRFPVEQHRDMGSFAQLHNLVMQDRYNFQIQARWAESQGPHSPRLIEAINVRENAFDAFLFFTYLYYHAIYGLPLVASKSILVPFAHDEPMLYLPIYRNVFHSAQEIVCQTPEEKNLIQRVFGLRKEFPTAGVGINPPKMQQVSLDVESPARQPLRVLYIGRIEEGKGCQELFDYVESYHSESESIELRLIGKSSMTIPSKSWVKPLGFVSEELKWRELIQADLLILPSRYESLSMVVLEAMSVGTPVLVNGHSEVLVGHCVRSNAGLWYRNYEEFRLGVKFFQTSNARDNMRSNGIRYVADNYTWTWVDKVYDEVIQRIAHS